MFSHIVIGTSDIDRAKGFYDAVLGALGAKPGANMGQRVAYRHNGGTLLVTIPINGEPVTSANGGTIGFTADTPEQVNTWHKAGCANGGATCEDPPGVRDMGAGGKLYLAYLRDPDGNKLCALHRMPA